MSRPPLDQLGEVSTERFLSEYWQKKPLLIRQAIPDFVSPVSPEELAGLAMEEEIESRIVQEQHAQGPWHVESGPFTEACFQALPEKRWTLLVQAVDQWLEEPAELLDLFRFIPNWRLDDLMVSYAPDQGSVGPHFDYYDVFLLQGLGRRRWQIGQVCDQRSALRDDCSLGILKEFKISEEWVLEPGDMLYVPPQLAHHGVALEESMTYSIGFRAPSQADILTEFSQEIASNLSNDQRYQDAGLPLQANPGEIKLEALAKVRALIQSSLDDPEALASWFGRYMTQRKYPDLELETAMDDMSTDNMSVDDKSETLYRHPASRFAYHLQNDNKAILFVDGQQYTSSTHLAMTLSASSSILMREVHFSEADTEVIRQLMNAGALFSELPQDDE